MTVTDLLGPSRHAGNTVRAKGIRVRTSRLTVWLLILLPFVGIVKGFTGNRYAPLLFDTLLFLVFLSCFATNLKQRRFDLLDGLLGAFLALAFVQMFNPNVPSLQAGIEGFRKFAFISIAFYLGRRLLDIDAITRFQKLLILSSCLVALYGVKQFFHMSDFEYRVIDSATAARTTYMMGGHLRPFSTLPGPFHLGLYLLVAILWIVTSLLYVPALSFKYRLALGIVLIVQIAAVFLTRTKSTWIALGGALVLLVLLKRRRLAQRLFYALIILAVVYGAVMLSLAFLPQDSIQVLRDAIYAVTNISDAPTFDIREELWATTIIPAMLRNPLAGFGTSSAGEGLYNLYENTSAFYFASHNLYFKIVLELGLLGLGLFVSIVGISVYRGYKVQRMRRPQVEGQAPAAIWGLAVVTGFLIAGLASPVLDAYPANYYFWLLLGILAKGHGQWTRRSA